MPRFYCPAALQTGLTLELPAGPARHVQVLRLQPGDAISLFNHGPDGEGWDQHQGGEFDATVTQMGRSNVQVQIGKHHAIERENTNAVHLAIGMPANERMDWLVEKAVELGVASIQPLMTQRTVLRLSGERAGKKQSHWQSIAIAACEQCGGNRVPVVHPVMNFDAWLTQSQSQSQSLRRAVLSLREGSVALTPWAAPNRQEALVFLCGPEGGLSPAEEEAAIAQGFAPVSLGKRVLRSETAALAALVQASGWAA
jgi:16S rRNA (uracil1498-N3)-methyltransferase